MEASKPASNPFEKIFHYGFVDPGQDFRMLLNLHGRLKKVDEMLVSPQKSNPGGMK